MPRHRTTVSIVMPIFNGERFLRSSLDSLLAQTFQDFEVICVNDGSTDLSESIINEYAERDSRVKTVNQVMAALPLLATRE